MRRRLCAALVVLAVLWTGVGLSVLAISAHEHLHHAEPHDHHAAVEVALHGHAHDGSPDHDHDLTGPVQASRDRSTAHLAEASMPRGGVGESELHRLQREGGSSTLVLASLVSSTNLVTEGSCREPRKAIHYSHPPSAPSWGVLFLGPASAEVFGDYGAGPNHTLPTGGSARSAGGLSVHHFLRPRTWLRLEPGPQTDRLAADGAALGRLEGLEAHARAAERRSSRKVRD